MNYQVFSYMPSTSAAAADPQPRPIRVTPSALSPLLYAILYSIEFQSPVGPRPPTLRDPSAGRSPGRVSGGGGGRGGAAAPSATALLTSAVSVMSSFWGRTATNAATTGTTPSQQQQQGSLSAFCGVGESVLAGSGANQTASLSPPRTLTVVEEAELAALQRQHEQPFVVPVTQVLQKLGGVHITVRETHNPTITTAYARAMEEVEMLVAEHQQRLERMSLHSASFSSHPGAAVSSASPSASALMHNSDAVNDSASAKEENTMECYACTSPSAAAGGNSGRVQPLVSPASPTSSSRFIMRVGSPTSNLTAAAAAGAAAVATGSRGSDSHINNNTNSSNSSGGRVDELVPSLDEVGLVLSVRLSSKEVTRWRITHERPLVEWRFPIIRTSNERMMMRPRSQSPTFTSAAASSAGAGFASRDSRELGVDGGSAAHDFIMVNDAAQMHQVLEFILKTSYQTSSMETFTDFTSGELVFDAHVHEKRRFL
ncbi:hypothetical protein ABB37_03300 [Leptomonas pyrrhocoris]|uniref:Uncharacterized protein n=1 Tax=Leptomonas pyrrhocoris TaxID=157538 RepID=A0A0N0DWT5_LEPPY|nr:hypothetical protein ABB37_03300 [Leptomonas pyrrhocoris]KPA82171.1 hypothetical protein ABB37_03300 [Leptomonas pyrrhocoris]|eukprot:XP_015660610.1 hypothetical protein ABB37_03300 [Leptomonas pyrrhocoris]